MRQNIVLVALSALGVVRAQQQQQNYTVNIGGIDSGLKTNWCQAQYDSCKSLCGNDMKTDNCDPPTLNYTCTCSNGSAPGLQYYKQTIPTFLCNQAFEDCIAANTASSQAQDDCKKNILAKCGTLDPTKVQGSSGSSDSSSSSSAAGPTNTNTQAGPSPSTSGSPSASQNAPSSSSSHAAAAATQAALIGNGVAVVAAGLFAALL